jgi:glyoxylase-like metal-dependent hydrolase (beta-lactamase superfamily II)
VYLWLAEGRGWRITHVVDTHVHADHLSRSRRLAELVGATLHMPEGAPVSYPFSALGDGDVLEVGSATLEAIWTPGHTPESTSYLLDGRALFSGDTLFVSAVGRPDLDATPEGSREKARELYRSLQRLLALGPETLVLPGHTSKPVAFDGEPCLRAAVGSARERPGPAGGRGRLRGGDHDPRLAHSFELRAYSRAEPGRGSPRRRPHRAGGRREPLRCGLGFGAPR